VTLWTLRDGQHNSFPFVQPKQAFWLVPSDNPHRQAAIDKKNACRRSAILALALSIPFNAQAFGEWPGGGLLGRLRERRHQLTSLEDGEAGAVPATIDRFLLACDPAGGGDPQRLLQEIADQLNTNLQQATGDDWITTAVAVLLDGGGALMFDALGDWLPIYDTRIIRCVSDVLRAEAQVASGGTSTTSLCALTGQPSALVTDKFPQPNLPVLGQTYLFARNRDTAANNRYGRFSTEAMPVGQDTAIRLAAAIEALTDDSRRGFTWVPISGEAPKQTDLLLAFVDEAPDAPTAAALGEEDSDDDFAEEIGRDAKSSVSDSIAAFEKRTERVIEAIKAKVGADFRKTPVHLAIFRKVDPANRKVVYAGAPTVSELYSAATDWIAGERNVPSWLTLPVLQVGDRKPRPMTPPHLAPLGLIRFSKQLFIRGGTERQEIVGIPAALALGLYLDTLARRDDSAVRRDQRVLRIILTRRAILLYGTAHALRRGFDFAKEFDRREALRTVTALGILLQKLGRTKEDYMNEAAFKLGQLLAAADVVHVGYCADVRGGDVPTSLLGNQVFAMAQAAPAKALAVLCRRWKPYEGWSKKAAREPERADTLVASKKPDEQHRGWDIRKALRHAREMRPLADQLAQSLSKCVVNDTFRAELLLGYVAGLPKAQGNSADSEDRSAED
jgi:hypothetical protein